jgi:diguanylate cyclase (GGDEF)-like protein/PAS domain S-box-containing protein
VSSPSTGLPVPSATLSERFLELTTDLAGAVRYDGVLVSANPALRRLVGEVGERVATHAVQLMHRDDRAALAQRWAELLAGGQHTAQLEVRLGPAGGERRWYLISLVMDRDAGLAFFVGKDVDESRRAAERLGDVEARFRSAFESSAIGMAITGLDLRFVRVNAAFGRLVGRSPEDLVGAPVREVSHPDEWEPDREAMNELIANPGVTAQREKRYVRPDGTEMLALLSVSAVPGPDGTAQYVIAQMVDITQQRAAELALTAREAEYRALAEHSTDFLSRHDLDGRYLYASPASEALLGHAPADLLGRTPAEVGYIHPDDAAVVRGLDAAVDGSQETATATWRAVRPDGSVGWLETALRAVPGADGRPHQIVAVTRDVSERKDAELRLAHQALHDALTGLPNRALFHDRLEQALRRAQRSGTTVAVLFVDLDRFKLINDSFGHSAGDRLLIDVATRLRRELRPTETIARFGGDELTILCEDLEGEAGALGVARRIAAAFEEPFVVEEGEAFLQASVGIALGGDGATPEDLVRDADAAMYKAKERGRSRVEVFDEAMRADARARVATESALRRAIERDELRIHVQPVVAIGDGTIQGFEGLVRWDHPERGLVPPGEFIPLAEETGLVVPIGNWMLRAVCRTLRRWHTEVGAPWVQCSVNLSVRHLQQPDLVAIVRAALEEHGVPAHRLVLELTESAVMENGAATVETLHALRALGVRLALDDFGTGYSSLAHLHRFPLDVLKIDRSFTAALGEDHEGASIAGAIASLADALGLVTVGEGIEDRAQQRHLERLGCTFGQGFLFSRPQPPEHFDDALAAAAAAGAAASLAPA